MKKQNPSFILEIKHKDQFIPETNSQGTINIVRIKNNPLSTFSISGNQQINPELNAHISSNYEIIRTYLSVPEVHFYVGLHQNEVIGSFDLLLTPDNQIEIKNFGFVSDPYFAGLKEHFLSNAIEFSWHFNPTRIFFKPNSAEANIDIFLSRGFEKSRSDEDYTPKNNNISNMGLASNFLINYN